MSNVVTAGAEQLDLWLAASQEPESPRYNVPICLTFRGRVDETAVRAALVRLYERHPALRSSFRTDDDGAVEQIVAARVEPSLRVVRSGEDLDDVRRTAWAEQVGLRPLDMTTPGLLRSDLLLEPGGAVLVMTGHHIVLDAASVDLLVDDLCSFYEQAIEPRSGGAEEESRQDGEEPSGQPAEDLAYWLGLLHDSSEMLEPLPDLVRGVRPSSAGCEEASITGESVSALRAHFESALVSPAIGVLAAWTAVLHQWSGQSEGLLGIPFSGRFGSGGDDTVGLVARVLPVRSSFAPETPWIDHLMAVRGQVIESFEHSGVDTGTLRAELAARGQRYPTFRATFTHRTKPDVRRLCSGTTVTRVDVRLGAVKHDVALMVAEDNGGLTLTLDYDAGIYRQSTARAMLDQLLGLLLAAAASPSTGMGALLLESDAVAATAGGAGARAPHPTRTPPEMVVDAATSDPDRIAVIHGTESLTYGELVAASAQVARWLLQDDHHASCSGQESEELVAVLLSEGIDAVVAFLGIALAGKAYLPLEPGYPDEKLHSILRDSGVRRVLTSPEGVERLSRLGHPAHSVADVRAAASGLPAVPPAVGLHPDMLLNVLYTSGSTGRPKGVMLSHLGVSRLMQGDGYVRLEPDDRIAHLSPLNFDGATYEIWGALTHGARLVILDRELALSPAELRDAIAEHGVTMLMVTTPLFHNLVTEAPDLFQHLRVMVFGGDTAAVPQVARAVKWCGPGVLLHGYGPTENSFTSMFTKVDAVEDGSRTLSIGRCVPGTEAYVVHEGTFDLAPVGCPGELLLGGVGLARGYLGDPRRTAEAFVPDPFSGRPGRRLYRTGDRVRRLPGGEIEFVGRMDEQVKIRSQRIELGEIRSALLADPAVRACHVTTWRNPRDEKEIAAYLVMQSGGTWQDVRSRMGSVLPDFAVPTAWAELDELPLNANGKVDWRRLPAPHRRSGARPAGVRTVVAQRGLDAVRAAWCEVLGEVPPDDDVNFFEAGGHSLLLVRLQAMLKRHAGLELSVAELLRFTTVRAQAARLGSPDGRAHAAPAAGPAAAEEPIAIIGVAGRFALAPDVYAFWDNLRDARDCVAGAGTPAVALGDGRLRIDRWGLLDTARAFDAELFRLSPVEARATDPQHALLHECLWAAMENAAVTLDQLRGRTSIYAGCAETEAQEPLGEGSLAEGLSQAFSSRPSFAATRYSYRHDFEGESVMVDTACSTSLVAVHLACASLRSGASDYAFAGGVSIADPADGGYVYEPGMIYATDGVCRPFDVRATGTVGGDGAGVVLLKRLSDALRDGDPIHATIVGSAINNDGNRKAGYTAPGTDGQVGVFRNALRFAGRDAGHLGFVETHGTGTRLGDAVEATALGEVVGERAAPLPVSSVKSAIGHCNTAAGIAGLLTAVYALGEKVLPGTVNSGRPIEELTQNGSLRLLTANEEWPAGDTPRLAGVSSFGIGGTNACVLVEEFTEPTGGTHQ
ncbi:amino acid adenylation domain-containing protein [Streptomyces sp. MB09-01]|uniref:amino acid adenylation domain-containing protein n=1 Tax=Streptomyces sp. MB09-01 TaxID=3028666 RepID=UPI0029BE0A6C|nr:amino acid adenylation domain-containing protein [Streptomyces sp. MB09-01]MDX3533889.1 amino acid adenylation domain-containing protein [Streptomyces sp. MB09-01]